MNKKIPFLLSIFPILLSACGGMGNNRQRSSNNTSSSSISSSSMEKPPLDLMIWVPPDYETPIYRGANAWANQMKQKENIKINIMVKAIENISIVDSLIENPHAGPDIYYLAPNELPRAIENSVIQEITDPTIKNAVINENDNDSISVASIGDSLMALPLTMSADLSLYYDKSIFPNPQDVANMTRIINRCKETGKKVYFPLNFGYAAAYYFYAFGCCSTWFKNSSGQFTSYYDTFNSPNGVKACKAMYELISDDSVYVPAFGFYEAFSESYGRPAGACFSFSNEYRYAETILGDDTGCAELPYVTVDGDTKHLHTFRYYSLIGVKPQTDEYKNSYVQSLAYYLSSEEAQIGRAEYGLAPTNVKLLESPNAISNPGALAAIKQYRYSSFLQAADFPDDWYYNLVTIVNNLQQSDGSEEAIQEILNTYSDTIRNHINV